VLNPQKQQVCSLSTALRDCGFTFLFIRLRWKTMADVYRCRPSWPAGWPRQTAQPRYSGVGAFQAGRTTLPEGHTGFGCGTILYRYDFINKCKCIDSQIRLLPVWDWAFGAASNPKLFIPALPLTCCKMRIRVLCGSSQAVTAHISSGASGRLKDPIPARSRGE
jgi:hypothetical protein